MPYGKIYRHDYNLNCANYYYTLMPIVPSRWLATTYSLLGTKRAKELRADSHTVTRPHPKHRQSYGHSNAPKTQTVIRSLDRTQNRHTVCQCYMIANGRAVFCSRPIRRLKTVPKGGGRCLYILVGIQLTYVCTHLRHFFMGVS